MCHIGLSFPTYLLYLLFDPAPHPSPVSSRHCHSHLFTCVILYPWIPGTFWLPRFRHQLGVTDLYSRCVEMFWNAFEFENVREIFGIHLKFISNRELWPLVKWDGKRKLMCMGWWLWWPMAEYDGSCGRGAIRELENYIVQLGIL